MPILRRGERRSHTSMTRGLRAFAVSVVRGWTWIYTAGLHAEIRDRRRAEIESDLWESLQDTRSAGSASIHLMARLSRGIASDLFWRYEHADAGGTMRGTITFLGMLGATFMVLLWSYSPSRSLPSIPTLPAPPIPNYVERIRMPPPPPPPNPTWEEFVTKVTGKPPAPNRRR